jgi:hypothetical protein
MKTIGVLTALSPEQDDTTLVEQLVRYGVFLLVHAKIATCVACNDHNAAEKIIKRFSADFLRIEWRYSLPAVQGGVASSAAR